MNRFIISSCMLALLAITSCQINFNDTKGIEKPLQISGIYPHLAYYNEHGECGTGAVVPWADRLWVITYSPHFPRGSGDKLYEIDHNLHIKIRPESIGGTPANRMIHRESQQLFIGPYAIDNQRNVRAIPYNIMMGRHTGNARHLFDPENLIYYATMEEGFYEVNVHSLDVNTIYKDGRNFQKEGDFAQHAPLLPGDHGKGLYSGQGVLVYSNNGEASREALSQFDIQSGVLAEWDGNVWKVIRRNQFVEVTGPGGIYGNENPESDPIWATGWDHKSLMVGVRDPGEGWSFFRFPKASHSYDGAHGWNTEWPRIRDIGTPEQPDYLMTMHGMFWRFPGNFTSYNTAGIRPRSAYLKVIGDFARWQNKLVFGCDDAAHKEFLNKRKAKGGIKGPGQSNSNLWFTPPDKPDQLGPTTAGGAVWLNEDIQAGKYSEPFLFEGWPKRCAWIHNHGNMNTNFTFEIDKDGTGSWSALNVISVPAGQSAYLEFEDETKGEWIRIKTNQPTNATVHFSYSGEDHRRTTPDKIFEGLTEVDQASTSGGLLYGLGENRKALGIAAMQFTNGEPTATGYYELDEKMNLIRKEDKETEQFIREKIAIPKKRISIDSSSILIIDDQNRRWRLPLGDEAYTELTNSGFLRIAREVATERDLFSCHGTFYELPAENADGFAKIRPIASHRFRIHDYASYRGMLVMTGIEPRKDIDNKHIFISDDSKTAIWAGAIDDLWKLGKPTGYGGPWKNTEVKANQPSDPYLIGFYDQRSLSISHNADDAIAFRIEVEPIGHGPWMLYKKVSVKAGETFNYEFPENFQSRWIRFVADKDCKATTSLVYE